MNSAIRQEAERLAAKPYAVEILYEDAGDGEMLYVAHNPELEGCVAQGVTREEAEAALAEFRVDFIEHLLEHGLPVPQPSAESLLR